MSSQAEPASGAPGFHRRVLCLFNARTLPVQIGGTGVAAGLLAAGAMLALAASPAWPLALAVAGGALGASLVATGLARRATRALGTIADAAYKLRLDEAPGDLEIPQVDCTEDLRHASVNLRRMVEAQRRRQRALEEQNAALSRRLEARTNELTTLQDLSIGLASSTDVRLLVDEALGALEQTMDFDTASVWARSDRASGGRVLLVGYRAGASAQPGGGEDLTGMRLSRTNLQRYEQIERDREPIIENRARQSLLSWLWTKVTDDAPSSALYSASRSWMAVPMRYREEVLGVLRVDHREPDHFDPARARLLAAVSSQTALAMRHARLQQQQREVAVALERNRIARDLHDAVSQTLFAANVIAGALAAIAARETPPPMARIAEQAQALETLNRSALAEMRLLLFELRPDALKGVPLGELLKHAVEAIRGRGDIEVEFAQTGEDSLPHDVRVQFYRVAQEALSNVLRHSGARHCGITWTMPAPRLALLRITDDGEGFDTRIDRPGHFGLENMRSRAAEMGARLTITSTPGQGTSVELEWPAGNT